MSYRETFLTVAQDGAEMTAVEVAQLLQMNDSTQATQFLMRLKTNLTVERCQIRLRREKRDGKHFWKVESRC